MNSPHSTLEHVEDLGQARHFWQAMDTFAARVSAGDAGFANITKALIYRDGKLVRTA